MSKLDKFAEIGGLSIWYGAFILAGITFGLLLQPLLADAYEIVSDDFETYSLGNLVPYGGWATSGATAIPQVVNTTYGVVPYSGSKMIYFGDVSRQAVFPKSTSSYAVAEAIQTLSYYYYPYDFTTGTNAPGALMSFVTYSATNISQQTLYTCFYPTSGSVATFRISSGSNCNSGTITSVEYNIPQGGWVSVECSWTRSDNKFACSLNGSTSVQYTGAMDSDNYYIVPTLFTGYTYGEGFLDYFGWSSVQGPTYTASTTQVLSGAPSLYSYGNSSTSDVTADIYITAEDKANYSGFEIYFLCMQSPYDGPVYDGTFAQEYGYSAGSCAGDTLCTITATDIVLNDDKQYDCRAVLSHDGGWFSFRQELDMYNWSFYTFESSSTPAAVAWQQAQYNQQTGTNLTGTSTDSDRPFASCSVFSTSFDITDCLIAPIKFMFVPTETDMARNINMMHNTVVSHFPFKYMSDIGRTMREGVYEYATTTATSSFPDMSFETLNMHGVTTTVTILDGDTFISTWSELPMFETIRTVTSSAMYLIFLMLVFFRLRRLIPQADNIKSV